MTKDATMPKTEESKGQSDKFKDLARELETDDSEERFDDALLRIARSLPPKDRKPDKDRG